MIINIILCLVIAYVLLYIWHTIRKSMNGPDSRKNQKHNYIVLRRWFRVLHSGSYAWLEVDFGRPGSGELVILFGCTDMFINCQWNRRMV